MYKIHKLFQLSNSFCKKSIGNVKQFLQQYCDERRQAGFTMLQDPLAVFYEAICVGLDLDESLNTDDFFQQSPEHSGKCSSNTNIYYI